MAVLKPPGWELEATTLMPQRLLSGERNLAIAGAIASALMVVEVAPKVSGSFGVIPYSLIVCAGGVVFYLAWMAGLAAAWAVDPWLSRTLPRFLAHPDYIPAHSTGAVPESKRRALRAKDHLKR